MTSTASGVASGSLALGRDVSSKAQPSRAFGSIGAADLLEVAGLALRAHRVLRVEQTEDGVWRAVAQWPEAVDTAVSGDEDLSMADLRLLQQAADLSLDVSPAVVPSDRSDVVSALAIRLDDPAAALQAPAALVALGCALSAQAARMVADMMAAGWLARHGGVESAGRSIDDVQARARRLFDVLQMSIALGSETRFLRAAFSLCNQLSVRFACEQAALGWVRAGYVRLTALSHVEKFDAKASATRELENAMEEAVEQDTDVVWPTQEGARTIVRAHETFGRLHGVGAMLTLPLRMGDEVVAVLSLGRQGSAFTADEIWELRLIGQACVRRMADLRRTDRWIGARALDTFGRWRDLLLGPSHTAWKLAGLAVVAVLMVVALLPWPYRIDASLTLRSNDVLFIPAPFDGYLRRVGIEVGDRVEPGQVLLELDTRELVLEESMAVADELRFRREAEKAQGSRQLAEMQIALARQRQAASKLELIRYQLANASLRSPFESIVVEGELKKNLGAPVRKGDVLVKLAQTGDLYLELEVDQADIHEVRAGVSGEFAFVGRPDLKYPLVVQRIDPQATQREGRNVYLVRCRIMAQTQSWWRPGMGGSARIEVDERRLLWVLTHRTVRFLRQVFWI